MIELDQLLRETDLCVQGLRKYFWQLVPWLVQEQKINTIGLDQSTSINFWERHICEFKVCVYFWQLVPWLVQKLDCVYFFALAPARALAVKNIYANLELTNQFLLIIDPTGSCLFFCSCTSQGTSYQKYTHLELVNRSLSESIEFDSVYLLLLYQPGH